MTLHWELAFDNPPLFFSFAVYLQKCYFIEKEGSLACLICLILFMSSANMACQIIIIKKYLSG